MQELYRQEWVKGFVKHHSGASKLELKKKGKILQGYYKHTSFQPFFVYSEDFSLILPYIKKAKYLLTHFSEENLNLIEKNWPELSRNKDIILCLIDFNTENYALLKPFAHSLIVEKENIKKSIKGLMSP